MTDLNAQAWDVAWADEFGHMRRLAFEAGLPARAFVAKQTQQWAAAAAAAHDSPQQPLAHAAYAGAVLCYSCKILASVVIPSQRSRFPNQQIAPLSKSIPVAVALMKVLTPFLSFQVLQITTTIPACSFRSDPIIGRLCQVRYAVHRCAKRAGVQRVPGAGAAAGRRGAGVGGRAAAHGAHLQRPGPGTGCARPHAAYWWVVTRHLAGESDHNRTKW